MNYITAVFDRTVSRAAGEPRVYRFVAATEGKKDDGIDLAMSGADLARFKANPVIFVNHAADKLPVGKAVNVFIEGARLLIDVVFDVADQLGAEIERRVREGFLSAISIGFKVLKTLAGRAVNWELLEASVVGLPMDADATVLRAAQTPLDALTAAIAARLRADAARRRWEANRLALLADLRVLQGDNKAALLASLRELARRSTGAR